MLPVWKVTILRWSFFKSFEHIDISWELASKNSGERKLEEARRQINSANRSALDAWLAKIQLTNTRKDSGVYNRRMTWYLMAPSYFGILICFELQWWVRTIWPSKQVTVYHCFFISHDTPILQFSSETWAKHSKHMLTPANWLWDFSMLCFQIFLIWLTVWIGLEVFVMYDPLLHLNARATKLRRRKKLDFKHSQNSADREIPGCSVSCRKRHRNRLQFDAICLGTHPNCWGRLVQYFFPLHLK